MLGGRDLHSEVLALISAVMQSHAEPQGFQQASRGGDLLCRHSSRVQHAGSSNSGDAEDLAGSWTVNHRLVRSGRVDVKAKGRLSQGRRQVTFGLPPNKGSSCLPPNATAAAP